MTKEIIQLDKVPEGKERITFELRVKLGVNWNYDIVCNTFATTNYKPHFFFENDKRTPTSLSEGLNSYLEACFAEMEGIVDAEFKIENVDIPKECQQSYDKFLKAHAESEKTKVKKEIEELENKAKQLKEKLKKL
mgnify:CR=1 FL=1